MTHLRTTKSLAFLLVFSACSTATTNKTPLNIIAACSSTANSYPYVRDRLDYDAYGDLFTEDATFKLNAVTTRGRSAIVDALRQRGPAAMTRHFSTVVHMEAIGSTRARGVSYLSLYRVASDDADNGSTSVSGPWVVGEYHDEFVMQGDTCRISSREIKIVFDASKSAAVN